MRPLVIGWTGSHSTMTYLNAIVPVLEKLEKSYDFKFLVISNQPPAFTLKSLVYLPWKEATEIDDLLQMNIGIMPLEPDEWSEGKCGFKLIQYLSLGIPAVASPVGVNNNIIEDGRNGFLCVSPEEWESALVRLLSDRALRTRLGFNGQEKMRHHFSLESNEQNFLSLFLDKGKRNADRIMMINRVAKTRWAVLNHNHRAFRSAFAVTL
jgi:glycosyltransferase involved in cell wall biosynthesis